MNLFFGPQRQAQDLRAAWSEVLIGLTNSMFEIVAGKQKNHDETTSTVLNFDRKLFS